MTELLPKTHRLNLNKSHHDLVQVLLASSLYNKNLYNNSIFVITNLKSCFEYKEELFYLKDNLHINQQEMLNFINKHILIFNELQSTKFNKKINNKLEKVKLNTEQQLIDKNIKKPKLFKPIELYTDVISKDIYYQFMNETFLQFIMDKYCKYQSDLKSLKCSDYELLSGITRQTCIQGLIANYSAYHKNINSYLKNKGKFQARPQPPQYLSKNSHKTIEIPWQTFSNNQKFSHLKHIDHLTTDYKKENKLSKFEILAYESFSLQLLLDTIKSKFKIETDPVLIRIVAKSKKIKIEAVFNTKIEIIDTSLVAEVIKNFKSNDTYLNSRKKELSNLLEKSNEDIITILSKLDINLINKNIAGVDLGSTNVAAIGYHLNNLLNLKNNNLSRGKIISANDYHKHITKFNKKIDKIKSSLSNKTVDKILSKRENYKLLLNDDKDKPVEKLTKEEIALLHQYQKSTLESPDYKQALLNKNNYVHDYIHKLTAFMADDFHNNGIDLVVIGKNIGWKQDLNLGKKTNRKIHDIPHAKIINILRYKCYERGILLVSTEESYTSKTSFINNSILKEFNKKNLEDSTKDIQENNNNKDTTNNKLITKSKKIELGGVRLKNRHQYRTNNNIIVHADLNAAYNIIRKIVNIKYNKHSIKCDVNRLEYWSKIQNGLTEASRSVKIVA